MPWTNSDPRWQKLSPYEKAAAMSLMEADRMDPISAMHALDAMVNRSGKEGVDLGEHVSQKIYQPTIEPAQQRRLDRILSSETFPLLAQRAEDRVTGREPDFVGGATHFLAPESTMLSLERSNPSKYKNWGPRGANWTGYDPSTGAYKGVVMRDQSHAFLAPEGTADGSLPPPAPPSATPRGAYAAAPARKATGAFMAAAAPSVSQGLSEQPQQKSIGGAFGSALSGFAGAQGGSSETLAQLAKSGQQTNQSALAEEDQRQANALKTVLQRAQTYG